MTPLPRHLAARAEASRGYLEKPSRANCLQKRPLILPVLEGPGDGMSLESSLAPQGPQDDGDDGDGHGSDASPTP